MKEGSDTYQVITTAGPGSVRFVVQHNFMLLQIAAAEAGKTAARQESETNHRFVAHAKW